MEIPAGVDERLETPEGNPQLPIEDSRHFEGESSFAAHAVHASEAVEMSTDDVSGGSSDLKSTLGHLNTLLQPLPLSEDYSFHSSLPRSMPNIKLLPTALVVGILQRFKSMVTLCLQNYRNQHIFANSHSASPHISVLLCCDRLEIGGETLPEHLLPNHIHHYRSNH